MSSVIDFFQRENVAVLVHGVADGTIVKRVVHDVQRIFRHIVGGWTVTVSACARGQWRLELCGASGRHIWMIAATAARLPVAVAEKLESFLRESSRAWRPVAV